MRSHQACPGKRLLVKFFGDYSQHELGSGFLIDADGRILTNNHVISGSSQVEVTLPSDQSRYKAQILARDRVGDSPHYGHYDHHSALSRATFWSLRASLQA